MRLILLTLFPEVFEPFLNTSIIKRAQKKGLVEFDVLNIRDFGEGKHKTVDDRPYGGSPGMVLKATVLSQTIKHISKDKKIKVILTSPSGKTFNQKKADQLSKEKELIIICGHYEGVDERFVENYVSDEISIGDYILSGGEVPAMVIIDSIVRLIPGVLKKTQATKEESFSMGLLEYPHYTRPEQFEGKRVPEVLLSGDHKKINLWRMEKAKEKTNKIRPDLLK